MRTRFEIFEKTLHVTEIYIRPDIKRPPVTKKGHYPINYEEKIELDRNHDNKSNITFNLTQ